MRVDPSIIVAMVAFVGSVASVALTGTLAARSARVAQQTARDELAAKVDAEAFKRARENYDAAIAEQDRRIVRLNHEIDENRGEYLTQVKECQHKIDNLQRDLRALREWALPLLQAARAAGIQYADPPVWIEDDSDGTEGVL